MADFEAGVIEVGSHPAPPVPGMAVARHVAGPDSQTAPLFCFDMQDVEPDATYVAEVWVQIPSEFRGTGLGLVMFGYFAEAYVAADIAKRDQWQKISVTSHVPANQQRMMPSLLVSAEPGEVIFSAGWSIRRKDPVRARPAPSRQRSYKLVSLRQLTHERPAARAALPSVSVALCLPDVDVAIPPVSFGQTQRPDGAISEWPPDSWHVPSYSVRNADLYTLRDAVVHGEQGIVTVGDYLVTESLHFAQAEYFGFKKTGNDQFELPETEPHLTLDSAAHLLCGYVGNRNYAHWWVDVVPALLIPPFHGAFAGAQLLWPKIRHSWQTQTLALLPEAKERSVFVGEYTTVACRELRFVPQITASDMTPHPFRSAILNAVKERAGHRGEGGRRIYVSRRDAHSRRLLNEGDVIALLERNGFEAVTLTGMNVREQIKLFASASHVIGPHGAGLGNVLFCPPGSVLCEFQMRSNVQWSIRRLAAVSHMQYGCIMGTAKDDSAAVYLRDWTVDLGQLEAALRAPAFQARR